MTSVLLYGRLRKRFNKSYDLAVKSPAEAIRALSSMVPGFEQELRIGSYSVKLGDLKNEGLEEDQLHGKTDKSIHIVPIAKGSKNKGVGKVLAGIALVAVSFAVPGSTFLGIGASGANWAGIGTASNFLGTLGSMAKTIGLMMAFQGASMLLSPRTKAQEETQSYLFSGPENTTKQGNCVPVFYGKGRAGTVVVSSGISSEYINRETNNSEYINSGGNPGYDWSNSNEVQQY